MSCRTDPSKQQTYIQKQNLFFFLFFWNPQSHILVCHGSFTHIHVQCKLPHIMQKGKKKKKKKRGKKCSPVSVYQSPRLQYMFSATKHHAEKGKTQTKDKTKQKQEKQQKIRQKPTPTSVTVYPGYATHFLQQNIRQKRKTKKERKKTKQKTTLQNQFTIYPCYITCFSPTTKIMQKRRRRRKKTGKKPPHTPTSVYQSSWLH